MPEHDRIVDVDGLKMVVRVMSRVERRFGIFAYRRKRIDEEQVCILVSKSHIRARQSGLKALSNKCYERLHNLSRANTKTARVLLGCLLDVNMVGAVWKLLLALVIQ